QNNEFVDLEEQKLEGNTHEEAMETTLEEEETMSAEADQTTQADEAVAEQLNKQLEEANSKLLRVQADYDNFRKRTQKEKEELAKYASAKLIENLLPSIDNFDRALAASEATGDFEALAKGLDMIYRQLKSTMEAEGLAEMEPVGTP